MVNIVNHFDTIHPWMTRMVEVGQMGALRGQISEDWHLWWEKLEHIDKMG